MHLLVYSCTCSPGKTPKKGQLRESYYGGVQLFDSVQVVLTLVSVYEILECDHSNESYRSLPSFVAFYHAVHGGSHFPKFWSLWMKSCGVSIHIKATE